MDNLNSFILKKSLKSMDMIHGSQILKNKYLLGYNINNFLNYQYKLFYKKWLYQKENNLSIAVEKENLNGK